MKDCIEKAKIKESLNSLREIFESHGSTLTQWNYLLDDFEKELDL
jgi:hypothetical protein